MRAELVDEAFRVGRLLDDSFLVVLSYASRQLVVIHCRSILAFAPKSCNSNGVLNLEYSYKGTDDIPLKLYKAKAT